MSFTGGNVEKVYSNKLSCYILCENHYQNLIPGLNLVSPQRNWTITFCRQKYMMQLAASFFLTRIVELLFIEVSTRRCVTCRRIHSCLPVPWVPTNGKRGRVYLWRRIDPGLTILLFYAKLMAPLVCNLRNICMVDDV